jgi:hypothetical protein
MADLRRPWQYAKADEPPLELPLYPSHSALRIVGWTLGLAALSLLLVVSAAYAPMVVRCTQKAEGWLAEASASLKSPPAALREAVFAELRNDPANLVTRNLILTSGCSGWTPERGHDHMIDELVMKLPLRMWFSQDELLAIMMGRAYMGTANGEGVYGFDKAARTFYGRELGDLEAPEFACLARKLRAPNHSRYRCNGY